MRFGSLFSGVGGFDLGLELAGWECAWQVEIDEQCRAVLRRHWPDVTRYEDVQDVRGSDLAPVDLICGGFPCQDLSVAGRREGLAGERSGLWYEFHRIIGEAAPRWVLIENVPGLLSSNEGRDLSALLGGLAELGYWWTYRVLDSQYFGVPQRRRRVFIVGHSGGPCPPEVLLEPEGLPWNPAPRREAREGAAGGASRSLDTTCGDWSRTDADPFVVGQQAFGGNRSRGAREVSTALNAHGSGRYDFETETFVLPFDTTQITSKDDPLAKGAHAPAVAPTLQASGAGTRRAGGPQLGSEENYHPVTNGIPRRLTPTEAERLQGLPDGWTAWGVDEDGERVDMADTPRYRMMGNAVTMPMAAWIGCRILELS